MAAPPIRSNLRSRLRPGGIGEVVAAVAVAVAGTINNLKGKKQSAAPGTKCIVFCKVPTIYFADELYMMSPAPHNMRCPARGR